MSYPNNKLFPEDLAYLEFTCITCNILKPKSEFRKGKGGRGHRTECNSCGVEYNRKWRKENMSTYKTQNKKYNSKYKDLPPEKRKLWLKSRSLRHLYKITLLEYQLMFKDQKGLCKICNNPPQQKGLGVDHCHTTKQVRGLLCSNCNTALGKFHDDIEILKSAIKYLEESRDQD